LRFAITATDAHGVNVHVVGVIVLLVGVLGLLLSLLVWSPLNPNRRRNGRLGASDAGASPRIVREYRRTYRDGRTYRDEPPPVVEEVSTYLGDPPR
jgi:hypothetical protein